MSPETSAEFVQMFLAVRDEQVASGWNTVSPGPKYQEAVEYARKHGLPGGEQLLQATLLEKNEEYNAALLILDELANIPSLEELRMFMKGSVLAGLGKHSKAVEIYQQFLSGFDSPLESRVRANLGITLLEHGRAVDAITELELAEADPSLSYRAKIWSTIGSCYHQIGDLPRAAEYLEKAIADPDNPEPEVSWHDLALVQVERGELSEAVTSFRNAGLKKSKYSWLAWFNLGRLLYTLRRPDEAEAALKQALSSLPTNQHEHGAEIVAVLDLVRSQLDLQALSGDDKVVLQPTPAPAESEPEYRIASKLNSARQTQYEAYLQKPSSDRQNVLSVLRGWSSAVTLLEGSEALWRGGGYLFKWQGFGIAVDPGFNFIGNLHDAGYHGREVDCVLVSHNHPDHNADLPRLDDLRYELYKRRMSDPHGGVRPYVLFWDADSHRSIKFATELPEHQHHSITFDLGRCVPTNVISQIHSLPLSVEYFGVKHGDLHNAVGFKLIFHSEDGPDFTVGYSGDTEFFSELPIYLAGCDVLIAHISQPDAAELSDASVRKKIHLGYRGTADLIEAVKPKLTLVGEFWAGLADIRIDLVQGLRRLTGNSAIFPAGIGLHLTIPSLQIECSDCANSVSFTQIRVAPATDPFGNLAYLCNRCLLQ